MKRILERMLADVEALEEQRQDLLGSEDWVTGVGRQYNTAMAAMTRHLHLLEPLLRDLEVALAESVPADKFAPRIPVGEWTKTAEGVQEVMQNRELDEFCGTCGRRVKQLSWRFSKAGICPICVTSLHSALFDKQEKGDAGSSK